MSSDYYSRDTVDAKLEGIRNQISGVDKKIDMVINHQKYTNGKVMKHEKLLWAIGGAAVILGAMGWPNLINVVKAFIQ